MSRPLALLAGLVLVATGACAPASSATPVHRAGHATPAATATAAPAGADRISILDLPSAWRDQAGAARTLPELRGRVTVMALVYTSCQATCPLIVADLKRIEASLPSARRDDVRFVLVSLDPARDTPGRLAEWGAATRLDPARWTLLAGDDDAVRELAATLDVRYQRQPDGEMAHTNAVTVLDRDGAIAHQQPGLGETGTTVATVARLLR